MGQTRKTTTPRTPVRGGRRPGTGQKVLYRPKTWNHSMQFTPEGLARLMVQAAQYSVGRADYVEAQLREHADDLVLGPRLGRSVWPGKDARPRGFRLTDEAHTALRRAAKRMQVSEGDIVEGLVRQGRPVKFVGSDAA